MGQEAAAPAQPLEPGSADSTPPAPLTPEPAPAAPAPAPQPEPSPDATPEPQAEPEGAAPPETPEPVAWAELRETSDVLDHEAFAEPLEAIRTESHAKGTKEGHATAQRRMQGFLQQQTGHSKDIAEGIGTLARSLLRLQKQDGLDIGALDQLMEEHKGSLQAVSGIHYDGGKWDGARGLWKTIADAVGDTDIEAEFDSRIQAMRQGMPDAEIGKEIMESLTAAATKPLKDEIRELKLKVQRTEVEAAARAKNGQPQPAEVTGAGGGTGGQIASLAAARVAHANGDIDNAAMRAFKVRFRE